MTMTKLANVTYDSRSCNISRYCLLSYRSYHKEDMKVILGAKIFDFFAILSSKLDHNYFYTDLTIDLYKFPLDSRSSSLGYEIFVAIQVVFLSSRTCQFINQ